METIIRVVKNRDADPFCRIDKIPINDEKISFKAKGILTYCLSKPDGWKVNIKDLCNHATDQDKSVRAGLQELIDNQYCVRVKILAADTKRILQWSYIIYERPYSGKIMPALVLERDPHTQNGEVDKNPDAGFPHLGKPHLGKPHLENGPPINKVFNKQQNLKTKEDNNNKGQTQERRPEIVVVEAFSKKQKREYQKIKTKIINLGWVGPMDDIAAAWIDQEDLIKAWVNKVDEIKNGLNSPAAFLRKSIKTGQMPQVKDANKKSYFDDEYAEFIEA